MKDATTGLIWEQSPDSFHGVWNEAIAHCVEKTAGGQKGWRLPTIKELASLPDTSQHDPALSKNHPFSNVKSAIFWSATPSTTDDILAWHMSFLSGEAVTDQKSQTRRAWCVREHPGRAGEISKGRVPQKKRLLQARTGQAGMFVQ